MAHFLDPLTVTEISDEIFAIADHPFRYQSDLVGLIAIPVGFYTDFESMPRWVPLLYSLLGDANHEPAVVHDWLYYSAITDRLTADSIFAEACLLIGTPMWKRKLLYWGLRMGGQAAWNDHRAKGHPEDGKFSAAYLTQLKYLA